AALAEFHAQRLDEIGIHLAAYLLNPFPVPYVEPEEIRRKSSNGDPFIFRIAPLPGVDDHVPYLSQGNIVIENCRIGCYPFSLKAVRQRRHSFLVAPPLLKVGSKRFGQKRA